MYSLVPEASSLNVQFRCVSSNSEAPLPSLVPPNPTK